jgi:hypothetical protein
LIGHQLPHADDVEAYVLMAVRNIFHWRIWGKVVDYCLNRIFGIWRKGKILEIVFLQVGFMAE